MTLVWLLVLVICAHLSSSAILFSDKLDNLGSWARNGPPGGATFSTSTTNCNQQPCLELSNPSTILSSGSPIDITLHENIIVSCYTSRANTPTLSIFYDIDASGSYTLLSAFTPNATVTQFMGTIPGLNEIGSTLTIQLMCSTASCFIDDFVVSGTKIQTQPPTSFPTQLTSMPTANPTTRNPTSNPSQTPTTFSPTKNPTKFPSINPTSVPSLNPTKTFSPTNNPSMFPTKLPSEFPIQSTNSTVSISPSLATTTTTSSPGGGAPSTNSGNNTLLIILLVMVTLVIIVLAIVFYFVWQIKRKEKLEKFTGQKSKHVEFGDLNSTTFQTEQDGGHTVTNETALDSNVLYTEEKETEIENPYATPGGPDINDTSNDGNNALPASNDYDDGNTLAENDSDDDVIQNMHSDLATPM